MKDDLAVASLRAAPIFWGRLLIALIQAMVLYFLLNWGEKPQNWWIDNLAVFKPLLLCAVFLPIMAILDLGRIRLSALAIWIAAAAVVIAYLAFHAATRGTEPPNSWSIDRLLLPFSFWLMLSAALFVAQVLVVDSVREGKWAPTYAGHFDTAWRQGVQLVLAALFIGIFWCVLVLGAGLFKLVQLDFFQRLIEHRWFYIPATNLALAVAIHVTDVQPQIIRGARGLALALLSWLQPLLAVILAGFLVCLPFISLELLWRTHFAASLLLTAAFLLIFLINCCYQDGTADGVQSRVKRFVASLGAVELAPLVALAAWALALRVNQYGWSVERIEAAAVTAFGAVYAIGYALAVFASPVWLKRLEVTNIAAAYFFLALFLALFTPLADPGRLMVKSQVARLKAGAVGAEKFDFEALKFDGARWGAKALADFMAMPDGAGAEAIRARAAQALAMKNRWEGGAKAAATLTVGERTKRIDLRPAGKTLPGKFLDALAQLPALQQPNCFKTGAAKNCVAQFLVLDPDRPEAILFIDGGLARVFEPDEKQEWRQTATLTGPQFCPGVAEALQNGDLKLARHPAPDILTGGQRLIVTPMPQTCAKKSNP